jgi:NAD(P)H-dependent FMN reductase
MKLQVIIGSSRQGRVSDRVAKWVVKQAETMEGVEVEIVDLADYDIPMFNLPISPKYDPNYAPNEVAQKFLDKLTEGEAYVFVTPEYNHSIPGSLKNALDYISHQFRHKVATVVSHGSVGGARAAEQLKLILLECGLAVIPPAVAFVGMLMMEPTIEENGDLQEDVRANPYGPQTALANALSDLRWHSDALTAARN